MPIFARVLTRSLALLALNLVVSHVLAQLQPEAAAEAPAPKPVVATPERSPEEVARRSEVVASFATGKVTVGELEDAILEQNPFMQTRYLTKEAVHALLDRSVRFELLAGEAERRGYAKDPAVRLAVSQNVVQSFIKQEFDDKLTPESVPADLVRQYYDSHIEEFVRPQYRRASMLVVASDAEARALLPQLQIADMRAFRDLARNKSTDAVTRQRGGDVRYFDASGHSDESEPPLDAKLAKAVFSLKNVGDTTPIVQVEKTYVVAKLTGQRAAQSEPLKLADDRIRMRLWRERRQAAIDAKLAELRTELHAEVHPELVDSVQLDNLNTPLPPDRGLPDGFPQVRPGPVLSPPQP